MKPSFTFPISKKQFEALKKMRNTRVFVLNKSNGEEDCFVISLVDIEQLQGKQTENIGKVWHLGMPTDLLYLIESQ